MNNREIVRRIERMPAGHKSAARERIGSADAYWRRCGAPAKHRQWAQVVALELFLIEKGALRHAG